ncbi:hypothetical protein ACHAW5_008417 [Stephanodiscus triporus]|uniref:DUF6824 domain-containing protein n=1 Tax=Stephanodiscus triporus TaxID=2934178 RepID=A0ABD3QTP5_9STRA
MDDNQYFFELNPNDVLCGRGSGPNYHVGNVEFRNLVMTRKAEYLASACRGTKGRIADDIINAVRSRGGRFLRKLSPEQAMNTGFKWGTNVFELADAATVLEKTKQLLRQSRADFLKENGDVVDVDIGGSSPAPTINDTPSPEPTNDVEQEMTPQSCSTVSSKSQNETSSSIGGSWNPLPLGASVGLDLSARVAELINMALSSTSSNCSSVTNPSFTKPNRVVEDNYLTSMSRKPHFSAMESTSSGSTNSANYSTLSMTTAELFAAMGGSNNASFNKMSSLDSSNASRTSAQAFGELLNEYNLLEEAHLREQIERAKAERGRGHFEQFKGQALQNQNNNCQHYIHENQQVAQSQFYSPQLESSNDQITSNTVESMKAQLLQQQRALKAYAQAVQLQNSISNHYQSNMQYIPEEAQVHFHPPQLMQEDQTSAANVFASLAKLHPQRQSVGGLQQHEQMQQHTLDVLPSDRRRLSADDEQKLLQQFQQMQQRVMYHDSSIESEVPQNDSRPKQNQPSNDEDFAVKNLGTFNPSRRRKSRRSRKVDTFCGDTSMKSSNASVEMLNVEPVDFSSTDESVRLSFQTANRLVETLDMSTTSTGMSGLNMSTASTEMSGLGDMRRSSCTFFSDLDSSMVSLHSLSLSEPLDAHLISSDINGLKKS